MEPILETFSQRTCKIINNVVVTEHFGESYRPYPGGLGKLIFDACDRFSDKICQIYAETGQTETFRSFKSRSIKLALALRAMGIGRDDVITSCSFNMLNSALPFVAAMFLGAKYCSLDPTMSAREIEHLMTLVEPRVIFAIEEATTLFDGYLEKSKKPAKLIVYESSAFEAIQINLNNSSAEVKSFQPILIGNVYNEAAIIFFSSGTTGFPKGILASHAAIYTSAVSFRASYKGMGTAIHFTTLYWVSAMVIFFACLIDGNPRVLVKCFDVNTTFEYISKYGVTLAFIAYSYAHQIINAGNIISKYDLSKFKYALYGGGCLNTKRLRASKQLFPHTRFTLTYGITEVIIALGFNEEDLPVEEIYIESSGRPVISVQIKVVCPETGRLLGPNEKGELWLKSDFTMMGYIEQPSVLSKPSDLYDADGFMRSGDIGHYNENGFFFIEDRIKEMFKYQSWHIVPASIESIIKEIDDVIEAVVFGIPNDIDGEWPAAAIQLIDNSSVTEDFVQNYVNDRVINRQRLRAGVYTIKHIPKTTTGKLLRRTVRQEILDKHFKAK